MGKFNKQFRGYDKNEVDSTISSLNSEIDTLKNELEQIKDDNSRLTKQISINDKTNEEIARLALKEASDLIEKAKRNANMILKESMEYVRGLSKDMDTFKKDAIDFRENVVKMSEDMLETIDKSEIFSLIREEKENTVTETDYKNNL